MAEDKIYMYIYGGGDRGFSGGVGGIMNYVPADFFAYFFLGRRAPGHTRPFFKIAAQKGWARYHMNRWWITF